MYTTKITILAPEAFLKCILPTRRSDEARYLNTVIASVRECYELACERVGFRVTEIDPTVSIHHYEDGVNYPGQFMTIDIETDDLPDDAEVERRLIARKVKELLGLATRQAFAGEARGPLDLRPYIRIKSPTPAPASA